MEAARVNAVYVLTFVDRVQCGTLFRIMLITALFSQGKDT